MKREESIVNRGMDWLQESTRRGSGSDITVGMASSDAAQMTCAVWDRSG